jgi:hypothetical protein
VTDASPVGEASAVRRYPRTYLLNQAMVIAHAWSAAALL